MWCTVGPQKLRGDELSSYPLLQVEIHQNPEIMPWIPTKAPRHPINTACQAPFGNVVEWTAAPLNGTYCVGDAPPALNASPRLPPVRLAPFGCDENVREGGN
jgi:hypothetical protein